MKRERRIHKNRGIAAAKRISHKEHKEIKKEIFYKKFLRINGKFFLCGYFYSTVTLLARFRGLSTSQPRATAM
jgi:hypothetical protein